MPEYSGEKLDWLMSRTFIISNGCMTTTWAQPDTQPQKKSFTVSRIVIKSFIIKGGVYPFLFNLHLCVDSKSSIAKRMTFF